MIRLYRTRMDNQPLYIVDHDDKKAFVWSNIEKKWEKCMLNWSYRDDPRTWEDDHWFHKELSETELLMELLK